MPPFTKQTEYSPWVDIYKIAILMRILLLLLFCVLLSCKDEKCGGSNSRYQYDLEVQVSLTPIKEVFSVDDTISISVRVPRQVLDRNHEIIETLSDLNIRHGSWVRLVDSNSLGNPDVINNISLLENDRAVGEIGIEDFGNISRFRGSFERLSDGGFGLDYSFTLNSPGVLWFSFGGFFEEDEPADSPIVLENECRNGVFTLYYKIDNVPEGNILLLCEPEPPIGFCQVEDLASQREEFGRDANYVFKVEE